MSPRLPWYVVLGVGRSATREEIVAAYRREAKRRHPDVGGTAADLQAATAARDEGLAQLEATGPRRPRTVDPDLERMDDAAKCLTGEEAEEALKDVRRWVFNVLRKEPNGRLVNRAGILLRARRRDERLTRERREGRRQRQGSGGSDA